MKTSEYRKKKTEKKTRNDLYSPVGAGGRARGRMHSAAAAYIRVKLVSHPAYVGRT